MFITKLESLRGIAALMVAVSHCLIVFAVDQNGMIWTTNLLETQGSQAFLTRLLLVPFNGGAAVTIFFVLSGYVLGLSLDRKSNNIRSNVAFYIKRIFRIYPAYIVCLTFIIFSIALFHTYIKFPNTSVWFQAWYQTDITFENAMANYALLETNLNQVAWTLKVELIMSLLFPFAYLVNRNVGTKLNLIFLFLLVIVGFMAGIMPFGNLYFLYGFVFYVGLLIPIVIEKLNLYVKQGARSTMFIMSVACLLCSRSLFSSSNLFCAVLIETIFAALIVAILADEKTNLFLSRILDFEIVRKLGRFSYSFYIYHFIILYWLAYSLLLFVSPEITSNYPLLLGVILAIISVTISYYVAMLSYFGVERPMIKYGAVTAEKIAGFAKKSHEHVGLIQK
ncbi:acyltransferase family protein [Gimesia aquarii]|uniref:Acyltransferase family protein n=1 Tax=Gimesia aquarii TaxID=2527964 RepID=A0A517WYR9_9PLAN|nr:acyltransferase [Gimesia aquarii]QDU10402.1 Acyltransferase family protein [Gimesia aquarii]